MKRNKVKMDGDLKTFQLYRNLSAQNRNDVTIQNFCNIATYVKTSGNKPELPT